MYFIFPPYFIKWQLDVRLAIYKSAAALTARLTPHRHPCASRSGAEAKRTHERINRTKPIESAAARSRPR